MKVVAVSISKKDEPWHVDEVPFYCHTAGYMPILHHDNSDPERRRYITTRYNLAIQRALELFPDSDNLMIIDSYYVPFASGIRRLVNEYTEDMVLGASIWVWDQTRLRPFIRYYETLSVSELRGFKARRIEELPSGLLPVSAVGGCWIFPRKIWDQQGPFPVSKDIRCLVNSRCFDTHGLRTLLDCDVRMWRRARYNLLKRARVSIGHLRRAVIQ